MQMPRTMIFHVVVLIELIVVPKLLRLLLQEQRQVPIKARRMAEPLVCQRLPRTLRQRRLLLKAPKTSAAIRLPPGRLPWRRIPLSMLLSLLLLRWKAHKVSIKTRPLLHQRVLRTLPSRLPWRLRPLLLPTLLLVRRKARPLTLPILRRKVRIKPQLLLRQLVVPSQ